MAAGALTKAAATKSAGAATKAAAAKRVATKPAATKPAAAKAVTKKPAAAKTVAAKPAAVPGQRPTPYRRTPVAPVDAPAVEESQAEAVVAEVAAGRRPGLLRRRPPSFRRRPSLYLAAALVGALGVSLVSAGDPTAHAVTTASHSVSVADKLGIEGQPDAVTSADAAHLGELAASRNQRGAEQAAAARAQAAANRKAVAAAHPSCVLPVPGARLTSTFGMRWGVLHAGIDLAAPIGTPEYAAMDGIVLRAGPASGFGLAVYIQHANGDVTVYGHMEQILVTEGQVVKAGQTIALLGQNGQATGPHLHFEVHVGGMMGTKIDPIPWLRARGVSI
jgi:murein DD-endopeptidase MepM/ murein hydrolase activator NlpD